MAIPTGRNGELLRAIGRVLDAEFAEAIVLSNTPTGVRISWRSKRLGAFGAEQRLYQDPDLAQLEQIAQQSRGTYRAEPREKLAEALRTLGQELDREQWDLAAISQERDGLVVAGTVGGQPVRRTYRTADLLRTSRARRTGREGADSAMPAAARDAAGPDAAAPDAALPQAKSGLAPRLVDPGPRASARAPLPGQGHDGPLARRLNK
jgi:hypothetical protein